MATLYYQTTSKPYIEFLRGEIKGTGSTLAAPTPSGETLAYRIQSDPFFTSLKGWGDAIWDLWLNNGGSAPVAMTTAISNPEVVDFKMGPGGPATRVQTLPGRRSQLERSTSLGAGSWTDVGSPVIGAGSILTFTDPPPPAGGRAFYRVRGWIE